MLRVRSSVHSGPSYLLVSMCSEFCGLLSTYRAKWWATKGIFMYAVTCKNISLSDLSQRISKCSLLKYPHRHTQPPHLSPAWRADYLSTCAPKISFTKTKQSKTDLASHCQMFWSFICRIRYLARSLCPGGSPAFSGDLLAVFTRCRTPSMWALLGFEWPLQSLHHFCMWKLCKAGTRPPQS